MSAGVHLPGICLLEVLSRLLGKRYPQQSCSNFELALFWLWGAERVIQTILRNRMWCQHRQGRRQLRGEHRLSCRQQQASRHLLLCRLPSWVCLPMAVVCSWPPAPVTSEPQLHLSQLITLGSESGIWLCCCFYYCSQPHQWLCDEKAVLSSRCLPLVSKLWRGKGSVPVAHGRLSLPLKLRHFPLGRVQASRHAVGMGGSVRRAQPGPDADPFRLPPDVFLLTASI